MAVVLTCYYRPKPGGFCKRLQRAMQAVLDQGHHLHYLAIKPFPIVHERCTFHRFPWPEAGADSWFFWGMFHFLAPVMLFCLGLRFQVTHAFGFNPTYAFFLQPLRILRRPQVTCFIRGDGLYAHDLKKRPKWIIHLDGLIEGLALHGTRVVCLRESLLNRVLKRHPAARPVSKTIIPNDLQVISAVRRQDGGPLQVGMVGLLEPVKNQAWTLRMMADLNRTDFHLHLFGTGPDRDELGSLARSANLADSVTFWGWAPPHRIWPQLDLLLMPSLDEGMPNAVLEAVGHNLPVLASNIPAHRDILPDLHCLSLEKPDQWRRELIRAARNPQAVLGEMADHQLERARSLIFDWEARVTALIVPSEGDGANENT
jgi:glycosyltransferase involved in cell wall biosynthesis